MNDDAIVRIYQRLQAHHHELRRALTWEAMRRILAREGIALLTRPLPRPAKLIGLDGEWAIVVDTRQVRRRLWYVAHEYAHFKLHVEASSTGQFEQCYNMDEYDGTDPRESEAEFLASLMLGGQRYIPRF